jgi:RNA-directed DNA polymerase
MNSLPFKKNQFKYLASRIKCNPAELDWVLKNINDCYYEYKQVKKDKSGNIKTFADKTPKLRVISPSYGKLKRIQSSIKRNILDSIEMPSHVQGATRGKINITNAKLHQGKKFKFTTDLANFFPSITNALVYSTFLSNGFTNHQASDLTKLTTYKYGLPQGAPTSPALANLCFLHVDDIILRLCNENKITFSRFVDDLSFSSSKDFKEQIRPIIDIILSSGFKISYRKTFYRSNQTITGIDVFNNFIDVPSHIKLKALGETKSNEQITPYSTYQKRVRITNTNMISRLAPKS